MISSVPLKRVARIVSGQSPPSSSVTQFDGSGKPFLQGNAEFGPLHPEPSNQCSNAPKYAMPGDILLSVRAPVGALNLADQLYGIGRGLCAIRPIATLDTPFAWWALIATAPQLSAVATGSTYDAVTIDDVGGLLIPETPLADQRNIARYLDIEAKKIDALTDAREGLVHQLEVRLLNLAHQLTSSGSERVPLRRLVTLVKTGATPQSNELEDLEGQEVPWYSPGDFSGWLQLEGPARSLQARAITEGWVPRFPAQSVLVVGIGATAGKIAYLSDEGAGNQQITCLVTGQKLEPRFLAWQLLARQDELRETAPFTTLPILNNDFIRSLPISLPPISEQRDAANRLDQEATKLLAVRKREEEQIALLQERRQALITAAVTGQLDIPEAA